MSDELEPSAAYYGNIADRLRDLARKMRQPEVRCDLVELAERFDRMARHIERRYPHRRGARLRQAEGGDDRKVNR